MKLGEFLAGRPDFASKSEVIDSVRKSKNFDSTDEDLQHADALLIFSTSKQHTWLVSTDKRLYCVLDDLRKDEPHINWSISRRDLIRDNQVVVSVGSRDKSEFTGLVDIGTAHRDWLYTKRLFSTESVEGSIRKLLARTMLAEKGL
jgi:hypothetical protein